MVKRDRFNIIIQHNSEYPDQADGGDSAARTGIMALAGSQIDRDLLGEFITEFGELVRHPYQDKWNDPKLTSRDQLIQWAAGVSTFSHTTSRSTICKYLDKWFINKDLLPLDVKLYLYKCVNKRPPLWIAAAGNLNMLFSLLWTCFVVPNNETNQMICLCSMYGKWWLRKLNTWHPGIHESVTSYWSGYPWRDQPEIGNAIKSHIEEQLKVH